MRGSPGGKLFLTPGGSAFSGLLGSSFLETFSSWVAPTSQIFLINWPLANLHSRKHQWSLPPGGSPSPSPGLHPQAAVPPTCYPEGQNTSPSTETLQGSGSPTRTFKNIFWFTSCPAWNTTSYPLHMPGTHTLTSSKAEAAQGVPQLYHQ